MTASEPAPEDPDRASASPRSRPVRLLLALSRWVLALGTALLLLEGAVRLAGVGLPPRGPNNRLNIRVNVPLDQAPFLYDTLKPNQGGSVEYPGYGDVAMRMVDYQINADGFRDRPESYAIPKPVGVYRIAVLGDSVTYGTGVQLDGTFPKAMERGFAELDLGCEVEVMNCGVFAHNTSQQVAWFDFNVARFEPDLVLIVSTIPDASGRNIQYPEGSEPETTWQAHWIERLGLTSGIWDVGDTNGLTPARARTMAWRRRSVLVDLVAHRLHGYLRGGLAYESYKRDWSAGSPGLQMIDRSLGHIVRRAGEHGFELAVAMYPTLVQLDENYPFAEETETLEELCHRHGVPFYDLLPPLMGRDGRALQAHPHDRHPNREAHGLVGAFLVDELRAFVGSD